MVENRERSIDLVFVNEGYKSNLKGDPGKFTMFGISSRYHPKEVEAMSGMSMEDAKEYARAFYRRLWNDSLCDHYQFPLDIIMFDLIVNHDLATAKALMERSNDWKDLLLQRERYYQKLCNRKWDGRGGWINRTLDLYVIAKQGGAV
jgi:lysozyme family protein